MDMKQQDIQETMEAYLLNNLSDADKQAFEARLRGDEALQQDLSRLQMEHRAMQMLVRDDLRAQMNAWKTEKNAASEDTEQAAPAHQARRVLMPVRWARMAAAASILLVIAFVANWIWTSQGTSADALAAEFYVSPSAGNHRGESDQDTESYQKAVALIQQKQYDQAIEQLSTIADSALLWPARLQMADAFYKKGDFANAADAARQIIEQTQDPLMRQSAEWLEVMARLASGAPDAEWKPILRRIAADTDHGYSDKAKELLKKL